MLCFYFEITPRPKNNPIMTKSGMIITRPKDRVYRKAIKAMASEQYKGPPLEGPLIARIKATFPKPKKTKYPDFPIGKNIGDVDNLQKNIFDPINGIAYNDDSQICTVIFTKAWALPDEEPCVHVSLERITK